MAVKSASLLAALALGLVVPTVVTTTSPAWAGDKARCTEAYEQNQELRRQKKLSAARAELLVCEDECPKMLATDCGRWRAEVEAVLPTVHLEAHDAQGKPVDAGVLVDGAPLVSRLGDEPVAVDPGEHVFRFVGRDGAASEVRVVLKEGEQSRTVSTVLVAAAAVAGSDGGKHVEDGEGGERRRVPVASYILGGVGVAGLALGTLLTIKGHVDESSLRSSCAPMCSTSSVDSVSRQYTVAWVGAGVGIAALGAALLVWRPWQREPPAGATASPAAASLVPIVTPVVTPGFAGAAARIAF